MGGLEEHIRQLNNYGVIFGTFWFNILCVSFNLIQIISSVVLLGYFHSVISIDYIWWPFLEIIRLSILTILRFDVMLKGVENYTDNRNGFKYTKRMIIICNLIGFFIILIGAPIYLSLLSTPTNSLYDKSTAYTIFMSIYPIFILIRILLTLPMYCTLITGTNPIYEINQGYQRIDDAVQTQYRRRQQQQQRNSQYQRSHEEDRRETHEERVQRQIRRQWRMMELERRQMELALEQSRRDAFRNTRKEQDEEYQRALKEAQEKEKREEEEAMNNANNNGVVHDENDMLFGSGGSGDNENGMLSSDGNNNIHRDTSSPNEDDMDERGDDIVGSGGGDDIAVDIDNEMYDLNAHIELDELPEEVEESAECVYIRIRLPNGIRSERRFHFTATIDDIILWTQHLCMKHKQIHLINHSQLISTMPHTIYNDGHQTMKQLKFWRPTTSKRKIVSPLLYLEEL